METMNENVVEKEEQTTEIVEQAKEPVSGEVYNSEAEAIEATTENEHSGLGLAAGIAIVAGAAAVAAGAKRLGKKLKAKKQKAEENGDAAKAPEPANVRKLTLKERLTGKINMESEENETEG